LSEASGRAFFMALLVLVTVFLTAKPSLAEGECRFMCSASGARASTDSFYIFGNSESEAAKKNAEGGLAAVATLAGHVKEYDYSPACRGNGVAGEGTGAVDCPAAHNCPDAGALRVVVSERVVGSPGWYRQPGTVCLNTDQQVAFNPADAQAFVDGGEPAGVGVG